MLLLACWPASNVAAQAPEASPSAAVLAPVGRQAGWLSLVAPRPRFLTRFDSPDYVSDVALAAGSNRAAIVVVHSPTAAGVPYGQIMALDLTSSSVSSIVGGLDANESLGAPVWWPDGSRLLYQREDVSVVGTSYAGGATVQYPSRIEQVNADGTDRTIVVDDARQPAVSPDGQSLAFVQRSEAGPTLVIRGLLDGTERILIPAGQFGDIVSPRYAPGGDRIAFMAPVGFSPTQTPTPTTAETPLLDGTWFGAPLRLAHGAPWDLWILSTDGSSPATRLAALGADDGTVAWSPDGSQLFVYGGTGSFIVDAATGEVLSLSFVAGYGATSWASD